jgi:hypothetical protein
MRPPSLRRKAALPEHQSLFAFRTHEDAGTTALSKLQGVAPWVDGDDPCTGAGIQRDEHD